MFTDSKHIVYYITVSLNLRRQLHELHYYLYNSKIMEMHYMIVYQKLYYYLYNSKIMEMHYMIVYEKLRIISVINVAII